MAISVIQSHSVDQVYSDTLTSSGTIGNTLFLVVTAFTTAGAAISSSAPLYNGSSVTGASKLAEIQSASTNGVYIAIWMLPNIQSSGTSVSITVTNGGTATTVGLHTVEVSGLGASPTVDKNPAPQRGTSGNPTSGATGTISQQPEFVIASNIEFGVALTAAGAPWTELAHSGNDARTGYQVATSLTSFTYALTGSGADWCGAIVTVAPTATAIPPRAARRTAARTPALPPVRRFRQMLPVPAQLNPPYQFSEIVQRRETWPRAMVRRSHVTVVVPPQVNPPFLFAEIRQWRQPRGFPPRRGHGFTPVPSQQAAPVAVFVPQAQRHARIALAPRRGRVTGPDLTQGEAPRQRQPVRPRPIVPRRRHPVEVVPAQVVVAAPAWVQGHRSPGRAITLLRRRFRQLMPWPQAVAPAFSIGTLTATDTSLSGLTAAGASSVLTAVTAPGAALTANDQRTGGPS